MAAAARKIDIKPYNYESGQDIELWLKRFEKAVDNLLDDDATEAQKHAAYLRNLPSKLCDFTFRIFDDSTNKANWTNLRTELMDKLTNPAKAASFQNRLDSIKWDGEEPIFLYVNKIKLSTKTLDPEVCENVNLFNREVFKRFLAGLPPDFRTYVEMGMPPRSHDIQKATERAEKYSDILLKYDGHPPLAGWALAHAAPLPHIVPLPPPAAPPGVAAVPGAVAAAAAGGVHAAYKADALDSMTDQLNNLSLSQRENLEMQKETNKSINALIEQLAKQPNSTNSYNRPRTPPHYQQSNRPFPSPNRQFNPQSPNRQFNYQPRSPRSSMGWSPNRNRYYNNGQNYNNNYSSGQNYNGPNPNYQSQGYGQNQGNQQNPNAYQGNQQSYGPYRGNQPPSFGPYPSNHGPNPNQYQPNQGPIPNQYQHNQGPNQQPYYRSPNRNFNQGQRPPFGNQGNFNGQNRSWGNPPTHQPDQGQTPPTPPPPQTSNGGQGQQNSILKTQQQNRVNFQTPLEQPQKTRSNSPFPNGNNEDF